jgi:hypothetical protein
MQRLPILALLMLALALPPAPVTHALAPVAPATGFFLQDLAGDGLGAHLAGCAGE